MRLLIATPTEIVADHADIVAVRAEDESGGFGILEGHADFLTALSVSVVGWRHTDGSRRWCAVRRGVLSVRGRQVSISTRQAQLGDDLDRLEQAVIIRYRAEAEAERAERASAMRLHTQAIRQIVRALRGQRNTESMS